MEFRELSEKEFVSYLTKSELDSFMQSPKMDIKGVCSYYVGVLDGKKVVAAARLTSRKNRFGYNYFYSPRGLLLDYKNEEVLSFFTSEIKKFIKEKKDMYYISIQISYVKVEMLMVKLLMNMIILI